MSLSREADGATFLCKAENAALSRGASAAVTLDILYPPAFALTEAQMLTVLENESLTLNYSATGKPNDIKYSWYKDGALIADSWSGSLLALSDQRAASLRSSRVSREDAGTFTLIASNSEGKANLTTTLRVNYPTAITAITSPIVVDVGDSAELLCTAAGQPPPNKISWQREDFDMTAPGVNQSIRDPSKDEGGPDVKVSCREVVRDVSRQL